MNYTEPFESGSDSDSGEETEDSNVTPLCHNILTCRNVNIVSMKPVLVTGTAGCEVYHQNHIPSIPLSTA